MTILCANNGILILVLKVVLYISLIGYPRLPCLYIDVNFKIKQKKNLQFSCRGPARAIKGVFPQQAARQSEHKTKILMRRGCII